MRVADLGRFVLVTAGLALAGSSAQAVIYTYDNTTSGVLSQAGTPCNNPLVRNFTVTDSFTVARIGLGLNASHNSRGHIRGTLVAPGGASFQFLTEAGDNDNNYDVLFSANTEGARDDGDADPVGQPYYNRLVSVGGMNFYTGNASGTWTLRLCDTVAATNGTFNRARLMLESAAVAAPACTGTMTFDWGSNGDNPFVSASTGDITYTQGATSDFAGTASTNAYATRTTTQGNHTGYYALTMDASAVAGTQLSESVGLISTINFSRPVNDLSFTLLDVDTANNSWEDLVAVEGLSSLGAVVPHSFVFPGTGAGIAGDSAEGDATTAPTSTNSNVNIAFQGSVQSLLLHYNQSDNPTSENVFMIVGISDFSFCAYDYGDAPNSYGTQLAGGARHVMGTRSLYLGTNPPDGEADGQPAASSLTDDTTAIGGVDDEDGVTTFPAYTAGSTTYTVPVRANNRSTTQAATLVGYLDWNRDGDFADAGERSASVNVPANTVNGNFNVTWSGVPANGGGTTATYARFRISHTGAEVLTPNGLATSGEVEDYQIAAGTLPVTLAAFLAEQTAGGIAVRFETETETATVGYRLLALTASGEVSLSENLLPSYTTDSLSPQSYSLEVPSGDLPAEGLAAFVLEDYDTRGEAKRHGPFLLGQPYGETPTRQAIDWATVAEEAQMETELAAELSSAAGSFRVRREGKGGFPVAALTVEREGIYRASYDDLRAAGLDFAGAPLDHLGLRLARSGAPIPLYAESGTGTPGTFGPGGFVEFRGRSVEDSLHTRARVYRLEVLPGLALRPQVVAATPSGLQLPDYPETVEVNRDRVYSFASPNGDPWYEDRVLANGGPGSRDFLIPIEGMTEAEGILEVDLWGVTDWPGDGPDHHLQLDLNGQLLVDQRFDGLTSRSYRLPLPSGLLEEGDNRLTVRLPGDTGFAFDLVHVDRYRITYPRRFTARQEQLTIRGTEGHAEIDGIFHPDVVVWAGNGTKRLLGARVAPVKNGYRVGVELPKGASGAAVADVSTVRALRVPVISPARVAPSDLLAGRADYLILTHPAFASGLSPLVSQRQGQGLAVKVIDVFDIYAAYTGGEVDPEALSAFVRDAAAHLGTRFVLLVGGDTYDPFDNLGIGSLSFVPTPYAQTDELIRFSPADPLIGDLDGDGVPEIPVGRFPVRTRAELDLLVAKTLAHGSSPAAALFAADGDPVEAFTGLSESLVSQVPQDWAVTTAYVDDLGLAGARAALLDAFDAGPALVSFVGHSGPTVWSFQGLFSTADANDLGNFESPSLVVQWGCWNSYHVAPAYDTLAHRLLLAGPQGAAAVLGSATLSKSSSDLLIGPALTSRLFVPGKTVGEAMIEAKQEIAQEGGDLRDVLIGWTLLGDPALILEP